MQESVNDFRPGQADKLYIITGGPGSGKSSLLSSLASKGYAVMPEAGRAIIQDQKLIGGPALPWADRKIFAELMLSWELRSYRQAFSMMNGSKGDFEEKVGGDSASTRPRRWPITATTAEQCPGWGPVFFDRGVPDVVGYLKLCGLEVPKHIMRAAKYFRYARQVFFAPPWEKIYRNDDDRKQSWVEAVATGQAMIDVYSSLGYEICHLPLASVEERADYVLNCHANSW